GTYRERTRQSPGESGRAEEESHEDRAKNRYGAREDHLLKGSDRRDVHDLIRLRLGFPFAETSDLAELAANLFDDRASRASYRRHGAGAHDEGKDRADDQTDEDFRVRQLEHKL